MKKNKQTGKPKKAPIKTKISISYLNANPLPTTGKINPNSLCRRTD